MLQSANSRTAVISKFTYLKLLCAIVAFCFAGLSNIAAYSQVTIPPQGTDTGTQNLNQNVNPGVQGTGPGGREGGLDLNQDLVEIPISDDTRNQGFVGATGDNILSSEQGFVGAPAEANGLAEGASFGGGANDSSPVVGGGGGGRGGQGAGGFTPAQRIGTEIPRRGVRAKLRPSFYAPRPSGAVVSNRFQSRFLRQPGSGLVGNGYSISVQNRTAFVSGTVNSSVDSERIVRQLRLEPGVYRVVNQLSVNPNQQPVSTNSMQQNNSTAPAFSQPSAPSQIIQQGIIVQPQLNQLNRQPINQPEFGQPQIIQPQSTVVAPNQNRNF